MDALWADTPGTPLFFVTGAGQGGASTWGSGFVTDKATIAVNDYSGEAWIVKIQRMSGR